MRELRRATAGTGVIFAGRVAQARRGVGPDPDRVASGRVQRRRAAKERRPVISGRQRLVEERRKRVEQRTILNKPRKRVQGNAARSNRASRR